MPPLSHTCTHTSHPRLQLLQRRDDEKLANEQARNNLESHIFETKDTMYSDSVVAVSTEDQRGVILAALTEAGDWMEEEGYGAETKVSSSFNMFHTWSWSVLHMQENASCAYVARCCWCLCSSVLLGLAIAHLETVFQCCLPELWLMRDCNEEVDT